MKSTAYQIGVLRDVHGDSDDSNIFELTLDVIHWAKSIKESYNSSSSLDVRFDELNISSAASLSYAIWHAYSRASDPQNQQSPTTPA
ncbi:MAG: hypothetical protein QNJ31_00475 [Candidatus Caenarcaniphilales bacterium]|nr:hypothetical protein [Candidatus Caenarcaniphilales bacterium]